MAEWYRNDPAFAALLLKAVLEDGEQDEIIITLRHMVHAFGGLQEVAQMAGIAPSDLAIYRDRIAPQAGPGR